MLKYVKYGFLPSVLQLGFPAASSATRSGDLQPPRPGGVAGVWRSGLGDHVAGRMVQQHHGGRVHPGRVRPLAEMSGMRQQSLGRWQC